MLNTTTKGVPRFLTTQFDAHHKDIAEKAVGLYIKDHELTPEKFAAKDFKIKWLLPYLQQLDRQWKDVPIEQMKTTPPRTLVSYMNTHLGRWKAKTKLVQEQIDALPESHDQTAEMPGDEKRSRTDTDNLSQEAEEKKCEEIPWDDQNH